MNVVQHQTKKHYIVQNENSGTSDSNTIQKQCIMKQYSINIGQEEYYNSSTLLV